MTSRSSCNSQLLFKTIKQNKAFIILHTIVLFLCTLMPAIMEEPLRLDLSANQKKWIAEYLLFDAVPLFSFVAMVAAFFVAFFVFSYLFRKDSTVMMHAFPITRTRLYLMRFLAAAVMLLVSPVVVFFINLLLNTVWGFAAYYSIGQAFINLLMILSHYVIYLAIFSFAAVISCHFFSYLAMSLFVMFAIPLTEVIIFGNIQEWFSSWSYNPSNWIFIACPFAAILNESLPMFLLENFLYGAACFVLGFIALKKRKSENGNGFLGFPKWQNAFKYYLTFMAAFGVGVGLRIGSGFVGDIWYFIAAFMAFVLLQGVFERSLHGMFRNMKKLIVVGLVILCVLIVGETDLFGIDNFVFPRSLTHTITVDSMYMPESRLADMISTYETDDEKGIDTFYELIEHRVDYRDKEENGNIYVYFGCNGSLLRKRIYVPKEKLQAYFKYIYNETDFITDYAEDMQKMHFSWMNFHKNNLYEWDISSPQMRQFISLYTEELADCSFEEFEEGALYGYVSADAYEKGNMYNSYIELMIPRSFEKSIAYIESQATLEYYDVLKIGDVYIEDRALCKQIVEKTNGAWDGRYNDYNYALELSNDMARVMAYNMSEGSYVNERRVGYIAIEDIPESIRMQLQMGPMPNH